MAEFIENQPQSVDYHQLYRQLVADLPTVAIFAIGLDRRITSWNKGVETNLGYSENEFIGRPFHMIYIDEDRQCGVPEQEIDQAIQTGSAPDQHWHKRKDGTKLFVDGVLSAVKDSNGTLIGFTKIMRDDTERYLADEAQRRYYRRSHLLSEMLKRLLENPDPTQFVHEICARVSSELGAEIWFNYFFHEESNKLRLFSHGGISEQKAQDLEWLLIGQPVCGIVARTRQPLILERIQESPDSDWDCVRILGAQAYVCYPLVAAGNFLGSLAFATRQRPSWNPEELDFIQDVSTQVAIALERARPTRELQNKNVALQRSNEDLAQFSSVVSHDLQAPLRSIKSYTQLLERRLRNNLDGPEQEFMAYISQGATHMESLIRGLLEYAQVNQDQIRKVRVRSSDLIDAVLVTLQPVISENQAEVICGPLPSVMGDQVLLQQLFQNLISNAIKYRRSDVCPRVYISAELLDGSWRFAVRDNGIGIPAEYAEKIFAPLQRLHGAEIPGTGIGLSVCKKIAERHGGQIWVQSEVNRGSTFFFTLPA